MVSAMRQCRQGRSSFDPGLSVILSDMAILSIEICSRHQPPFRDRPSLYIGSRWASGLRTRFAINITRKDRAWRRQYRVSDNPTGSAQIAELPLPGRDGE